MAGRAGNGVYVRLGICVWPAWGGTGLNSGVFYVGICIKELILQLCHNVI